jgi:hypothetical protein
MSDPKKQDQKPTPAPQTEVQTRQDETAAIAAAVAQKTLEAVLPSLIASLRAGQAPAPVQKRAGPSARRCDVCGFPTKDGKSECAEHEAVVAYPTKYPEWGDWFTGIVINGVKVLSNHESHSVLVPKGTADTVRLMVQEWERSERLLRMERERNNRRGSGAVGNNGANVNTNPNPLHWS